LIKAGTCTSYKKHFIGNEEDHLEIFSEETGDWSDYFNYPFHPSRFSKNIDCMTSDGNLVIFMDEETMLALDLEDWFVEALAGLIPTGVLPDGQIRCAITEVGGEKGDATCPISLTRNIFFRLIYQQWEFFWL